MKSLFILTLFLTTLVHFSTSDPSAQLLTAINSASMQLQALGTHTLNNHTFTQLIQVLNGVFGSMAVTTVPFYNTQITTLNKNAINIQNQIQQLTQSSNTNMGTIFLLIFSLDNAYTKQIWNIGNMLNNFQNSILTQISDIQVELTNTSNDLIGLFSEGNQLALNTQTLGNSLSQTKQTSDNFNGFVQSNQPATWINLKLALASLTLGSTDLAYCKSYIYTFPSPYSAIPIVETRIIFSAEPNLSGPNNYDLVINLLTDSVLGIWICDRSMSSFTLHPANLLIRVHP